ncbi:DUF3027 domain-containing protein [Haloferula sp. BvORR071]|uniref:DUF3027 domain-containing protein n=1 Tax=Haloferula sp. BvORR071 TaxID=1396141 RepID=UPI000550F676|nr:DUF3027 domain-containing protein [Haloferula sp. BvORR071]
MAEELVGEEEFEALVRPLIGLEVSLLWKGYGTAIFLELGVLGPPSRPGGRGNGEACIAIEEDWRVETQRAVAFGSSDSRGEIAAGIASLQGSLMTAISFAGRIRELLVEFSNGQGLRTMVMTRRDPEWSIRLPDGRWLGVEAGRITLDHGEAKGLSSVETTVSEGADAIAARWGIPRLEPAPGKCRDCRSFVHLDGDFALLDYGCCTATGGPFDGKVVHIRSGCPEFSQDAVAG